MERFFKRATSSDFESAPGSAEKVRPKRGRPPTRQTDEAPEVSEEGLSEQYSKLAHKLNQVGRSKAQREWAEHLNGENEALWKKVREMEVKLAERGEALEPASGCSTRASSAVKPEPFTDSDYELESRTGDVPEHVAVDGQATAFSSSASGSQLAMRFKRHLNEDLNEFSRRAGRNVSADLQSENAEIGRQASKRARFMSDAAGRAVDQTPNKTAGATSGREWGQKNPELIAKCREAGRNVSDAVLINCRESGKLGGRPRKMVKEGDVPMSSRLAKKLNPQRTETTAGTVAQYIKHVQNLLERGPYLSDEDDRLWKQIREDFPKTSQRNLKRWWSEKEKWLQKFKDMQTGKDGSARKNGEKRGSLHFKTSKRSVRAAGGGRRTRMEPLLEELKLWFEKTRSVGGYIDRSVMFEKFTEIKINWQTKFDKEYASGLATLKDILMHKALQTRDEAHERSDKNIEYSKNFMQMYLKASLLKPQRSIA